LPQRDLLEYRIILSKINIFIKLFDSSMIANSLFLLNASQNLFSTKILVLKLEFSASSEDHEST